MQEFLPSHCALKYGWGKHRSNIPPLKRVSACQVDPVPCDFFTVNN
jgi:hypothetical protein